MKSALFCLTLIFLLFCRAPLDAAVAGGGFDRQQQIELLGYTKSIFLARLGHGRAIAPPAAALKSQRACFVTFFAGKRVIACFGSFQPRMASLAEEIEANVAGALRNDPRARLIEKETALQIGIQVTFPGEKVPIADYRQFDPSREGLFAETADQGIAIVPQEAKTSAWAYREARRRLGSPAPADIRLYRFKAEFFSSRNLAVKE